MEAILILLGTKSRRLVENGSDQCRKKHELFQVPSLSDHSRQPLASFRLISIIGVNHHDKRCLVFRQKSIGSFQLFVLRFCFLRLPKCNNPNHCNPQLQLEAHPHILFGLSLNMQNSSFNLRLLFPGFVTLHENFALLLPQSHNNPCVRLILLSS